VTVLSPESRLVGTGSGLLPRVNLLPPEIAERAAFQRVQLGLGAAVVATLGVVGLLFMSASHGVTAANEDLASAQSRGTQLQSQTAAYRDVTATYAAAQAAQLQLTSAMSDEVRYSQLMNDLALSIPSSVWVNSVTFAQTTAAAALPGVTAAPPIGTMTVSGTGFTHQDVALWLESLSGGKNYANAYFSNSTEALLGTRKIVNFSTTADVTASARSGRYTKPIGG
jgi:Tfp pilus assembly protein PilN